MKAIRNKPTDRFHASFREWHLTVLNPPCSKQGWLFNDCDGRFFATCHLNECLGALLRRNKQVKLTLSLKLCFFHSATRECPEHTHTVKNEAFNMLSTPDDVHHRLPLHPHGPLRHNVERYHPSSRFFQTASPLHHQTYQVLNHNSAFKGTNNDGFLLNVT